ncbi:MAG: hypothetical protein HQK51_21605 [Oligoflexia bacterium]|nr:hypothetical protein [Oligoflexia bacterium]
MSLLSLNVFVFQNNSYSWDAAGKGNNPGGAYRDTWDANSTHAKMTEFSFYMFNKIANKLTLYPLITGRKGDIIAFSNAPDVDDTGNESGVPTMRGHFHNPETGTNYLGEKAPTAISEFKDRIHDAFNEYGFEYLTGIALENERWYDTRFSGDHERYYSARYNLGKALHFLQDLSMPFHAKNIIARYNPGDVVFDGIGHVGYENEVRRKFQDRSLTDNYSKKLPSISGNFDEDLRKITSELNEFGYNKFGEVINHNTREQASKELFAKTIMASADVLYVLSIYLEKVKLQTHKELLVPHLTCKEGGYRISHETFRVGLINLYNLVCGEVKIHPFTEEELRRLNAREGGEDFSIFIPIITNLILN